MRRGRGEFHRGSWVGLPQTGGFKRVRKAVGTTDVAPPAVKALRERLDEMSVEQALELLGPPQPKGNGAAPSDDPDPK